MIAVYFLLVVYVSLIFDRLLFAYVIRHSESLRLEPRVPAAISFLERFRQYPFMTVRLGKVRVQFLLAHNYVEDKQFEKQCPI